MTVSPDHPVPHVEFPTLADQRCARRRERDLAARVESIHARARAALDRPDASLWDLGSAPSWQSVATLAEECLNRLATAPDPTSARTLPLCDLVLDLHDVGLDLCHRDVARLERRLGDCATSLRRLHTLPSASDLVAHVCQELVARCGFGRAGLSRVESGFWRPWMCYQSNGQEFVQSWFPAFVDRPIPIGESTPEIASVSSRRPVVVHDTATTPVHRPIAIEGGRSISYVVAPVVRGKEVVGLLHADHCPTARRVNSIDGEVLGAFADGFGQLLEGATLMEQLREQRDHVWQILAEAARDMDALRDAAIDLSPWTAAGAVPRAIVLATGGPAGKLTARETEVFELLVAGATNGDIAEKLVITEDTVKSHVKHILRKLGVANRAQAIASSLIGRDFAPKR